MKRIAALVLVSLLVLSFSITGFAQSTDEADGMNASGELYANADFSVLNGKKIGITIQSLQNAYWAGVMTAIEEILDENGAEYTIVACNDSSAVQISQIENFISSGCDLIMVHPSDAAAVEDICGQAREKGIKVMCWDDPMENTDANWILNNTELGYAIGGLASDFINGHYTEENRAEVILIGYPQTKILLERAEGIKTALEELSSGRYEIIAEQAGIIASDAQTAVETTLQAHPDAKVVVGVGAGAMIGADEALNIYTGGEIPEEMGVFSTDVTRQQLEQLSDPAYPAKGIVGFEGSDEDTAHSCVSMFALILQDRLDAKNVFRGFIDITPETADAIAGGMK